ncbi:MAG TPA: hypothetical protein VFV07_09145, partial [Rhizomicrobium sp.]|nr:hypothetical protein [Rhizomicrobium sp.]
MLRKLSIAAVALTATDAHAALQISSQPTANVSCSGGACTATAQDAVLNVSDLASMLADGNVTVASGSTASDIEVDAALSFASANGLTLDAFHSITFNDPVEVTGTSAALTIITNDGGTGGDFRFLGKGRVRMWDTKDKLVINGASYKLAKNLKQLVRKETGSAVNVALVQSSDLGKQAFTAPPLASVNGTLEGLGNSFGHFTINVTSGPSGFVGGLASTGALRDLILTSASVTTSAAGQDAATLVADNRGVVANCFADGTVTATGTGEQSFIGGLVGTSSGSIQGSGADVTASGQSFDIIGGLVGMNFPTSSLTSPVVFQSYATGSVSAPVDNSQVGGLIGENNGGITFGSYARGAVTGGGGTSYIGGLIGVETVNPFNGRGPILNTSYSTGAVSGGAKAVIGGMLGIDIQGFSNIDDYWDLGTSGIG